jgi:hypothetical protein
MPLNIIAITIQPNSKLIITMVQVNHITMVHFNRKQ